MVQVITSYRITERSFRVMLAFFTTVEADILSEVTIYSRIMASAYRRIVERTLAPSADMGYALLLHNYS